MLTLRSTILQRGDVEILPLDASYLSQHTPTDTPPWHVAAAVTLSPSASFQARGCAYNKPHFHRRSKRPKYKTSEA